MAALDDFLKQNVSGPLNKVFLAGYIRDIAVADNKWKAVGKTILDVAAWSTRLVLPAAFIGAWLQIGKTVRAILVDTGSLDAAFKRLAAIQGFQRSFAPLVGGLAAAKQRVAELVQFSSRQKFFRFEDVGEGARNLEVMTRGVYSTNEALLEVQNAAVSSGNGFTETASAVGKFYADLREGQPIDQATEQLRQMGVISNQTASFLDDLQKSGAGVNEVFDGLKGALAGVKPPEAGEDLATVQQRRTQAGEQLKQAFGKPFTRDEIQNTKNYTDALNAIAPSVGRVAGFFSILADGLSTVKSSIAKTAAESKPLRTIFEKLAEGLVLVVAAAAAWGAIRIPFLISSWAAAAGQGVMKLTGLAGAARAASVAVAGIGAITAIGLGVAVVGTAIGVLMNYRREQKEIARQVQDMARAHREAQAAIEGQARAVKTLSDRNEVLAASVQNIIGLEQKLADLRSGTQKPTPQRKAEEGELEREIKDAKQKQQALIAAGTEGLQGPAKEQFIAAQLEKTRTLRRGAFQAAVEGQSPEGRLEIRRKQVAELQEQERQAEEGARAAMEAEQVRARREQELAQAQQKAEEARVEMRRRQQLFPKGEAKTNPEARRIIDEGRQNVKQAEAEVTRRQTAVAQVGIAPVKPQVLTDEAQAKVGELQKQLDAIQSPVSAKPVVLTDEAKAKVAELQKQISALTGPAVQPRVLTDEAKAKVAELKSQIEGLKLADTGPFSTGPVVLTDQAEAKVAELQKQIDAIQGPEVQARVLTDEAKVKVADLQKQLDAIQSPAPAKPVVLTDEAKAKVAELQKQIIALTGSEVQPRVLTDEAKSKVVELQKQITAITGTEVQPHVLTDQAKAKVAELQKQITALTGSEVQPRVLTDEAKAKVAELQKQIIALTGSEVQPRVLTDEAKAKVAELQKQITALTGSEVQPRVLTDEAKAKVAELQKQITALTGSEVQPRVLTDEAKVKVADLQKQITALTGTTVAPRVMTDEAKAKVAELQKQLAAIQSPSPTKLVVLTDEAKARVAELQKQIDAIKEPQPVLLSDKEVADRKAKIAELKEQLKAMPPIDAGTAPEAAAKVRELQTRIEKLKSPPPLKPVVLTDEAKAKVTELQKQIDAIQASPVQNLIDQGRIGGIKTDEAKAKIAELQSQIDKIKGPQVEVGFAAPKTSSVFAEAMARAIQNSIAASGIEEKIKTLGEPKTKEQQEERKGLTDQATRLRAMAGGVTGTPQDIFNWQYYAAQQRQLEQQLPQLSGERQEGQAGLRTETRQDRVRRIESRMEIEKTRAETGISTEFPTLAPKERERAQGEATNIRENLKPFTDKIAELDTQSAELEKAQEGSGQFLKSQADAIRNKIGPQMQQAERLEDLAKGAPTGAVTTVGQVDTKKAEGIEDTQDFAKRFQENIDQGLSEAEARTRAMSETAAGIAGKTNLVGPPVVASSLQRIGGGGGVYAPGGDQSLRLQERLVRLTEEANAYLREAAGQKEGVH